MTNKIVGQIYINLRTRYCNAVFIGSTEYELHSSHMLSGDKILVDIYYGQREFDRNNSVLKSVVIKQQVPRFWLCERIQSQMDPDKTQCDIWLETDAIHGEVPRP